MRYELIVFDWDGTLMDSLGTIVACAQRSMAELGLEPAEGSAIRDLVGLRLLTIAEQLIPGQEDLQPVSYTHLTLPTNREV